MANTEDIEARLCAYVDGELDAAGRAEIERHLTTNPQHRTLIEALIHQRDLLRALPRARAPIDIAETLNAQLERSALLNQDDWHEPIRISRWPQIRAAAAVLLLVFGLAAVVYYVVPSPNQPHREIVLNPAAVQPLREVEEEEPTTGPAVVTVSRGQTDSAMAPTDQQQRAIFALNHELSEAHRREVMSNAVPLGRQMMSDALAATPRTSGQSEVKMLVAAANPSAAQRQVEQYLQNRRIDFEPQAAKDATRQQLALDPSQTKLKPAAMRERAGGPMQEGGRSYAVIPQLPGHDASRAIAGEATATEPAAPAAVDPDQSPQDQTEDQAPDLDAATQDPQEQSYIARRMTRREVEQLRQDIVSAGQVAEVIEQRKELPSGSRAHASAAPTTLPSEFTATDIDPSQWKVQALLPFSAQSFADRSPSGPFNLDLLSQSSGIDADEQVDVLIVVRPDESQQRIVTQQKLADQPEIETDAEDLSGTAPDTEDQSDQPPRAPAPATVPSSP